MKRRFNYTGRSKILQEKVLIQLNTEGDSAKSFTADIDLDEMKLLQEAKVYLDAYHRSEYKRFDYGTVGNRTKPTNTSLSDLAYYQNLRFRVLVVDETSRESGLVLAQADKLRPISEAGKRSILAIDFSRDLGNQIWTIDYEGEDGRPILFVNNRIPEYKRIAESDPGFMIQVYPAVLREILTHMVFVDGVDSPEDLDEDDWHADWINYCNRLSPETKPPRILDPKDVDFDPEEAEDWIEKVVEQFCVDKNDQWKGYTEQFSAGREEN